MNTSAPVNPDVKVSVCMITYNHERFIAQAIESVLMQETDFVVELVIGEDCSTDGTRALVVEYAQRYPDRIRPLLPDHNLGMIPNFVATTQACGGQYIAILEGDDYWTDPHKLQKQVEFLDAHPECSMCFHDVTVITDSGRETIRISGNGKDISDISDILVENFVSTCSVVFRNGHITNLPDWCLKSPVGDWPLFIHLAEFGSIGYLSEPMASYRVHDQGVWSSQREYDRLQVNLQVYDAVSKHLSPAYTDLIQSAVARTRYEQVAAVWSAGDMRLACSLLLELVNDGLSSEPDLSEWTLRIAWRTKVSRGHDIATHFLEWIFAQLGVLGTEWPTKDVRRYIMEQWYLAHAFEASETGKRKEVILAVVHSVRINWRNARNRGLTSVFVSALLGDRITGEVRTVATAIASSWAETK